jgi:hypothetical protein
VIFQLLLIFRKKLRFHLPRFNEISGKAERVPEIGVEKKPNRKLFSIYIGYKKGCPVDVFPMVGKLTVSALFRSLPRDADKQTGAAFRIYPEAFSRQPSCL